jgi:glycosyltransferase involved in cell wall biosynthesis
MAAKGILARLAADVSEHFGRTRPARDMGLPFGVNVAGYFASEKGMGEAVRADVRCLVAAGIPHVLNHFVDRHGSENVERVFGEVREDNPYAFNLIHVNADQVDFFVGQHAADYFEGRYNIGFWVWELSDFPARWHGSFRHLDEIWVPSCFVLDALSRAAPVPVVRFPHSLALGKKTPRPWSRSDLGVPDGAFVFAFLFDFMSVVERKNPLGLVSAFRRAFSPDEPAWLVLKCAHSQHQPDALSELEKAIGDANVRVLDRVLDRDDVDGLMASCDAYVSLHRSEGFGITLAEAMALGKPVIATAYGGNTDFMTESNSFPVRYRLAELERDFGPYEKGRTWADPDLEHAASVMRRVFTERDDAARVAERGREDVRRVLAPSTVGRMMDERLRRIVRSRPGLSS